MEGFPNETERTFLFSGVFNYPNPALKLYNNAASKIGFGSFFLGKWFQGCWPPHLHLNKEQGVSIEWEELFAIVVTCAIWHPFFVGKRLQFWCDN